MRIRKRIVFIGFLLCQVWATSFNSFAYPKFLIDISQEFDDIKNLEDDIIDNINHGGVRSNLSRNIVKDDLEFENTYRIYSCSDLFKEDTTDTHELKNILAAAVDL